MDGDKWIVNDKKNKTKKLGVHPLEKEVCVDLWVCNKTGTEKELSLTPATFLSVQSLNIMIDKMWLKTISVHHA